jgi:hypothetical protein
MNSEDFRLLSDIGKALYSSPETARARSLETVAALSSRDTFKSDGTGLVRAVRILLYRAEKDGLQATSTGLNQPFYRLTTLERMALMAIRSGRVSYLKLSQILGVSHEEVEKLLWHSRMKLAGQLEVRATTPHPPGTRKDAQHACPELFSDRPWTQKLLDDEMKSFELMYLQNHLLVCPSCQRALSTTRQFYYSLEKWVPSLSDAEDFEDELLGLRRAQIESGMIPSDLSIKEGFRIFFSRKEVKVSVILFVLLVFAQLYMHR